MKSVSYFLARAFAACVAFAVMTNLSVFAQETFAPLITEQTLAFVYLDFHKIKLDDIEEKVIQSGQEYLRELSFDKKSEEATMKDLRDAVKQFDDFARPVWETITQTLGIQEIALIVDLNLKEKLEGLSVIAIPWKNKTATDLQKLMSLIPEEDIPVFPVAVGDFLIIPLNDLNDPEYNNEVVTEWAKELNPAPEGKIQQALKAAGNAEFKIATNPSEILKQLVADESFNDEFPKEFVNFLVFAQRKIEWYSLGVPLDFLLSKSSDPITIIVKTPKRSDAIQLRALAEQSIELGLNAAQWGMEQQMQESGGDFQIPPLAFSFLKGYLRTWLPTIDGDKLVLTINQHGWDKAYTSGHGAIAVSGVGIALLLPAVQAAREAARRMQCSNCEKQIVLSLHNYHDVYRGLPPLYTVDKNGKPLHSWRTLLLPFMEEQALYEKIRFDEPWDSEYNKQFHNQMPAIYQCPSNPEVLQAADKKCCYSALVGGGLIPAKKEGERTGSNFTRITDGTSNTIAVVEVVEPFCWMDPTADITLEEWSKGIRKGNRNREGAADLPKAGSFHPVGLTAAFFDGSVRFISAETLPKILEILGDPADGEAVPAF